MTSANASASASWGQRQQNSMLVLSAIYRDEVLLGGESPEEIKLKILLTSYHFGLDFFLILPPHWTLDSPYILY